ncbi:GNAT family N-acetyltransferase [Aeromicrobium sp.]|uniref:GNAT family N-acetyltransferase n=1 Tax=Aeromicrobium sp. TaxID=1871063 RepID=UPI003513341E
MTAPTVPSVRLDVVDPDDPRAHAALTSYLGEVDATLADGYAPGPDDLDPYRGPTGVFLLATAGGGELDGEVLGCGALRDLGDGSAEVKRMWVDARARGTGLGRRLLATLEEHARALGYRRVRLDTNDQLVAALTLYRSAGYAEIERYNDNPHARHWFEKAFGTADDADRP